MFPIFACWIGLRTLPQVFPTAALELLKAYEYEFGRLLEAIAADVQDQVYQAVLFAHIRSYDETPEKVNISDVMDLKNVENEAAIGKLMAGFRHFVILLQRPGSPAGTAPSSSSDAEPSPLAGSAEPSSHAGSAPLGSSPEFVQIRGSLPALLLPMATQDAPVVWEVIKRLRSFGRDGRVDKLINAVFGRVAHLSLCDSHASNLKAERADELVLSECGAVASTLRCRIHRLDTCEKRVVELFTEGDAGMMATTLMLGQASSVGCGGHVPEPSPRLNPTRSGRLPAMPSLHAGNRSEVPIDSLTALRTDRLDCQRGMVRALRKKMEDIVRSDLEVMNGPLPMEAFDYRREVERRYFCDSLANGPHVRASTVSQPRLTVYLQRVAWDALFNGDVRRTDRIEHYCSGCCKGREDTVHKMVTMGLLWLFRFERWSRKSWVGRRRAVAALGIVESTHHLLRF